MNLKEKMQLAWKNRGQIMEGFYNAYVNSSPEVKEEALKRLDLCRSNVCGLYNPKGENNETMKAVFPGKESCGGCGCDLYAKGHAMSAYCYLKDIQVNKFKQMLLSGEVDLNKIGNLQLTAEQVKEVIDAPPEQVWLIIASLKAKGIIFDLGPDPLWDSVMTVEQEIEINKIAYKKQFENRK